jgi:hypothetical protein
MRYSENKLVLIFLKYFISCFTSIITFPNMWIDIPKYIPLVIGYCRNKESRIGLHVIHKQLNFFPLFLIEEIVATLINLVVVTYLR